MPERAPQQFSESMPVLTMHGPDGSGKTTIGERVGKLLNDHHGDTLVIGSSGFLEWLDQTTYERFIGTSDNLEAGTRSNATPEEKTRLYEDIPICLFGVAAEHAASRGPVVIHSDPYIKRLIWARLAMADDEFAEYANKFDGYVTSRIGDIYASHVALLEVTADESYDRIEERGKVSEYDPDNADENLRLVDAVDYISEFAFGETPAYSRLFDVRQLRVENPHVELESRSVQIEVVASKITGFVCSSETAS